MRPLVLRTLGLFVLAAVAEIVGCYLPYLWLRRGQSPWSLVPAALSLGAFGHGHHRLRAARLIEASNDQP